MLCFRLQRVHGNCPGHIYFCTTEGPEERLADELGIPQQYSQTRQQLRVRVLPCASAQYMIRGLCGIRVVLIHILLNSLQRLHTSLLVLPAHKLLHRKSTSEGRTRDKSPRHVPDCDRPSEG